MPNKYMKKCSTSLATKEMQIKTTLGFHLTPIRMQMKTNAGKDVGKKQTLIHIGGNVNEYNHYRKQYGVSSKSKNRTTIRSSNTTYM
jgi:hypothetical protein